MRKLMAIVALLCGATGADADTSRYVTSYCSNGFEKPAVISAEGVVTIGGIKQDDAWDESWRLASAEIRLYRDPDKKEHVIIYRDRVFWPCKD